MTAAWSHESTPLPGARGESVAVLHDGRPATYAEVMQAWQDDRAFRGTFNRWLADATFDAFRWETPGVTVGTLSRPFEYVLIDDVTLDRPPDRRAFKEHFRSGGPVEVFPNLGRNAVMVVPCPQGWRKRGHAHLASFVRAAPPEQIDALWLAVGKAMQQRIGVKPVWLITAGAGVAWLHVRLDDRPKYYAHEPYRAAPGT